MITPFFALHGYNPRCTDELKSDIKVRTPDAGIRARSMQDVHTFPIAQNISSTLHYNDAHRPIPSFVKWDEVLFSIYSEIKTDTTYIYAQPNSIIDARGHTKSCPVQPTICFGRQYSVHLTCRFPGEHLEVSLRPMQSPSAGHP